MPVGLPHASLVFLVVSQCLAQHGGGGGGGGATPPTCNASLLQVTTADVTILDNVSASSAFCTFVGVAYPQVSALQVVSAPPETTDRVAVLIEPRRHAMLDFAVKHTMHTLNAGAPESGQPRWALQIFHSAGNRAQVVVLPFCY
jgi:hypothetical protein